MTIQLRYTTDESPWVFTPVNPTKKNFDMLVSEAFNNGERAYTVCDWRHLYSYLLADNNLATFVSDKSSENLGQRAITFVFKAEYSGVKHSDLYLVVSDTGSDKGALVCGSIVSKKIWRSIVNGFALYLMKLIKQNEPTEYSFTFRYSIIRGVSRRESQENTLWSFASEEGRRKSFHSLVDIKNIFSERDTRL